MKFVNSIRRARTLFSHPLFLSSLIPLARLSRSEDGEEMKGSFEWKFDRFELVWGIFRAVL